MKTTRLITHWNNDQLMTVIDTLDELRQALLETYRHEIEEHQNQRQLERQPLIDHLDNFDDEIPF